MVYKSPTIIFEPFREKIAVEQGESVLDASLKLGLFIDAPCAGNGTCGKCKVKIISGGENLSPPDICEKKHLTAGEIKHGLRLACRALVLGDVVVELSRKENECRQKILVDDTQKEIVPEPAVRKTFVISDKNGIKGVPEGSTAVIFQDKLVAVESGDTSNKNYGIAFDVGTTTIVGYLIDINSGKQIASASCINPQAKYGSDVISRINFSIQKKDGLQILHRLATGAINQIISEASKKANIGRSNIYEVAIAGNTCMHHIVLKEDLYCLAFAPYVPKIKKAMNVPAKDLGIEVNNAANAYLLPNIAGFVGGDAVADIITSSLDETEQTKLLIDLGTNGEIILVSGKRILACSTAAGPAFEGGHIKHGMRAESGAIESVAINEDGSVKIETIDNCDPLGITGSGLVDAVSEMLQHGIVDETGRIVSDRPESKSYDLFSKKTIVTDNSKEFILVGSGPQGKPITITQGDIREIQLAKAAISAGISVLKNNAGIKDGEISEILIAGAFGNNVRKESAVRIGLIPAVPLTKIRGIGNAAGIGAKAVLLSLKNRQRAEKLMEKVEYIELSSRKDFQQEFSKAIHFPK